MNLDEYQRESNRTAGHLEGELGLATSALGLTGEAGEVADLLKKHIAHGHPLDRQLLAKELGDTLWYIADLCERLHLSLGDVAELNIAKLRARYPQGFSSERSINRPDEEPPTRRSSMMPKAEVQP